MKNQKLIINALYETGIKNPISIAAIMAIVFKESNFVPQSENEYSNTSNIRIRQIFSATRNIMDNELSTLKKDPEKFFNLVYGGRFGNADNEGYKYRGRGFIQLTFKENYKRYGNILGIDLVNYPDLANESDIAAKITAAYMISTFRNNALIVKNRYGAKNINDFNNKVIAVNAFYNATAGFGIDTSQISSQSKTSAMFIFDTLHKIALKTIIN